MRINVFKSGGNSAEGGFVSNGLTLQGPLILSGPHSDHLHAVPKQYVDNATYNLDANNITSGVLAAARLPAFTGDATTILGTSNLILANTGVTPGSIIKPTVDAKGRVVSGGTITEADITAISFDKVTTGRPTTLNGYGITDGVPLSSNTTITGDLIQSADPVMADQVATKQYVDAASGLAGGISVGDIIRKPYTTTPSGFLKCNGSEVEKATYPNLYSVIGDRFADNSTLGCGKPWQHQYGFNSLQTSDVLGWSIGTGLPSLVSHCGVLATKNRVYTFGGYNAGIGVSVVYTAPINADGTIGTWVAGTSLPTTLLGSTTFITKNRVYLVGGATGPGATFQTAVYTAPINSDGTVGSWTTAPSLPSAVGYHKVVVIKNRVYTFGGYNGSSYISTIYTTTINDDGTINNWSVSGTTPYAAYLMAATVIKNRVYIMGGHNTAGRRDVHYAEINSDGTLGSWVAGIFLPKLVSYTDCFTTNNKIHVLVDADIYSADIYSDGSLGSWYKSATMPYNMGDTRPVITGSKIYLISSTSTTGGYLNYVIYANFLGGSNDYSSYYSQTSDTTVNYLMPGSGKPWQHQYQINTTQSSDITGWVTEGNLPDLLDSSQVIITKNRIYLLGGHNGTTSVSTVYTAPINADGSLGTWTTGTSLPVIISRSQAIVTKNRVYLLGGVSTSNNNISTVYTAPINSDGTLGSWTTGTSLPAAVAYSQAFITKNQIYICGGGNWSGNAFSTVYKTTINDDGTLDSWSTGLSLPGTLGWSQSVVTKNRVYLLGGNNGTSNVSTVYTAPINVDGTLGAWSTGTSLPGALGWSQSVVTKNRVYLFGGWNGSSVQNTVYISPINSDGTLGSWTSGTSLPGVLCRSQAIITKNRVYLLGGAASGNITSSTVYSAPILEGLNDYSSYYNGTNDIVDNTPNYMMPGSGRPWQQQYQINTTQTTDITGWSAGVSLPGTLSESQVIVTKNRVYLLGGRYIAGGAGYTSTVYTAIINTDGTLGTWTTGTPLPGSLGFSQAIVTKNRVYLLGGTNNWPTPLSTVYTAEINTDGTLGAWTTGTSLPIGLYSSHPIVTKNRVYLLGGYNGSAAVSTVYTVPINADGTLGIWTTGTALPSAVYSAQAIVTKNRVYLLGGHNGTAYLSTVYTAPINNDGTLGAWTTGTSLPGSLGFSQAIVTKNRVYLLGGANTSGAISTVYTAPINTDGTLGNWVTGTALPGALVYSQALVTKNRVYLLGGRYNSSDWATAVSSVYTAPILEGLNDLSPYYDGTIQPVSTISSKFKLPDYTQLDREFGEYVTSYIKY